MMNTLGLLLRYEKYSQILWRSLKTQPPRVRFAPSPTGFLHLGGLRTALYNFLFAKSKNGTMVLRIEDTDQTRRVDGALEALVETLNWSGINCDEGPVKGGNFGPYIQSERLEIYNNHVTKLLDNGTAYPCFCTERRLNLLRREAQRTGQVPRYDNKCRSLDKQQIKEKMDAGVTHCIRFKLTSECLAFEDIIFGGIAYDVTLNEGDPVIMKSDGYPTYHFANVVDDHLMRITHVLRGVEWQISTTKHILLYRAFGWEPPQFGHLPLIVNSDGTKLSKRQKDATVSDYRQRGILPLSLVNYITLSGGGFDHVPGEGVRLKTTDELASEFKLEKISSHPSRLNPDLLDECNRLEIIRQLKDPNLSKELVKEVQNLVRNKYPKANLELSDENVRYVLNWSTSRISKLEDLVSKDFSFLWVLPESTNEVDENSKITLCELKKMLASVEKFDEDSIKVVLRQFATDQGVQFSKLMQLLRGVLSDLREGPKVAEMMHLLGKNNVLQRIGNAHR